MSLNAQILRRKVLDDRAYLSLIKLDLDNKDRECFGFNFSFNLVLEFGDIIYEAVPKEANYYFSEQDFFDLYSLIKTKDDYIRTISVVKKVRNLDDVKTLRSIGFKEGILGKF